MSLFFTACGSIRLGEFEINERCTDVKTAETEALSYTAPEILSGKPYDEKSDVWSLGCVIYEMCMLKCAFTAKTTVGTVINIQTCSYEALPETFSEDLRQLVNDTLQIDPEIRLSVSQILMKPFIIKHLNEMSTKTIEELYKTLDVLRSLADGLESVHFNTTVSSLAGGVVGLAGGITSVVGAILSPFTLGASLIVTGVGIGVAVAGGVTAGVSNITKMVNQGSNRQKIKMIITEFQEKITSISCCIQNIQIAMNTEQKVFPENNKSLSDVDTGASGWVCAGTRLGRGLGGISELVRVTGVTSIGKVAAQTARTIRVAETATGVLSGLFVAVDIFFIALDSKEIHKLRKDYETQRESENPKTDAEKTDSKSNQTPESTETQQELENAENYTESKSNQTPGSGEGKPELRDTKDCSSANKKELELRSEIMKFVKKIRETSVELQNILDELHDELQNLKPKIPNADNLELSEANL